jgi:hypothetical protein
MTEDLRRRQKLGSRATEWIACMTRTSLVPLPIPICSFTYYQVLQLAYMITKSHYKTRRNDLQTLGSRNVGEVKLIFSYAGESCPSGFRWVPERRHRLQPPPQRNDDDLLFRFRQVNCSNCLSEDN